jgi:thioredoxin 1
MKPTWNTQLWLFVLMGFLLLACSAGQILGKATTTGNEKIESSPEALTQQNGQNETVPPLEVKTTLPLYNPDNRLPSETPSAVPTKKPAPTRAIDLNAPYDESAVPQMDIDAALTSASKDGKEVLLDFGANWCPDCLVLSKLFEDPSVKPYLEDHFYVVRINVGYADKNMDVVKKFGNPIEKGIPVVVVLNAKGETLASTDDGSLANARTDTAADILNFLKTWVAKAD